MRAARAADHEDFPLASEIRSGVELYLEKKCPLRLLQLDDLFERMRLMLVKIGCERIAEKLEPLAPPVTISLISAAQGAGNGFELAFFEILRAQISDLHLAGAEQIDFTGVRESVMILRNTSTWTKSCDILLAEIQTFLASSEKEQHCAGIVCA